MALPSQDRCPARDFFCAPWDADENRLGFIYALKSVAWLKISPLSASSAMAWIHVLSIAATVVERLHLINVQSEIPRRRRKLQRLGSPT